MKMNKILLALCLMMGASLLQSAGQLSQQEIQWAISAMDNNGTGVCPEQLQCERYLILKSVASRAITFKTPEYSPIRKTIDGKLIGERIQTFSGGAPALSLVQTLAIGDTTPEAFIINFKINDPSDKEVIIPISITANDTKKRYKYPRVVLVKDDGVYVIDPAGTVVTTPWAGK